MFDGIRSSFPKLDLDSAFESKDSVAKNVQEQLEAQMNAYGYKIVNVLIIDVEPDRKSNKRLTIVCNSMRVLNFFLFSLDS